MKVASMQERATFLSTLDERYEYWLPVISSFSLRLPEEAKLLGVVCELFTRHATNNHSLSENQSLVRGFVTSDSVLLGLADDENVNPVTRSRSAILLLLLSGDIERFGEYPKQILMRSVADDARLVNVLLWVLALLNVLDRN